MEASVNKKNGYCCTNWGNCSAPHPAATAPPSPTLQNPFCFHLCSCPNPYQKECLPSCSPPPPACNAVFRSPLRSGTPNTALWLIRHCVLFFPTSKHLVFQPRFLSTLKIPTLILRTLPQFLSFFFSWLCCWVLTPGGPVNKQIPLFPFVPLTWASLSHKMSPKPYTRWLLPYIGRKTQMPRRTIEAIYLLQRQDIKARKKQHKVAVCSSGAHQHLIPASGLPQSCWSLLISLVFHWHLSCSYYEWVVFKTLF